MKTRKTTGTRFGATLLIRSVATDEEQRWLRRVRMHMRKGPDPVVAAVDFPHGQCRGRRGQVGANYGRYQWIVDEGGSRLRGTGGR